MYLTIDHLKKIEQYLNSKGIKDTEFPSISQLNGEELLTLVQNNRNVKILLKDFLESSNPFLPEKYVLPIASDTTLGGIKVGKGLAIDPKSGILSVTSGGTADSVYWDNIIDKPNEFKPESHQHNITDVVDLQNILNSKQDKGDYALKSELPDISGLATKAEVDETYAKKTDIPNIENLATKEELNTKANTTDLNTKQDILVSGTNIKTINGQTILGEGNIEIQGGGSGIADAPSDNKLYGRKNGNWDEISIPSTDNFATKDELGTKADKTEIADMLTKTEASSTYQPKGNYLTKVPEEYITEEELNAKGYATTTQLSSKLDTSTYNSEKTNFATKEELSSKADTSALASKQDTLVSGTTIKTINSESLLGSGNLKFPTPYVLTKDSFDELNLVYSDSDYNVSAFKSGVRDNIVNCIENGTPINISLDIQNNGNTEKVNLSLNSSKSTDKFGEKLYLIGICDISGGSLLILISEFGGNLVVYAKISTEGSRFNAGGSYLLTNDFKKNERIVDSLTGGSGVLSANQGKVLNEKKQDKLVSGTNIKTINNQSLVGSGNVSIATGISDAPSNGTKYVRQNGGWVQETKVDTSTFATKSEISDMLTKTEASSTYQPKGNYALKSDIPEEYTLPIASADTLGGVKVGAGLSVNSKTGVLSATGGGGVADSVDWNNITSRPETFPPSEHTHVTADITDLQDKLDLKVDTTAIADMATKTWVDEQGYLTEHQDISNLATKAEVSSGLAEKQDKGNYITVENADGKYQPKGDYATVTQLNDKVDTSTYTEDKATFALKDELPDVSNLATKDELAGKADKTAIADMLTKTEASTTYQTKGNYLTEIPAEYITETELQAKEYATKEDVGTKLEIISGNSIILKPNTHYIGGELTDLTVVLEESDTSMRVEYSFEFISGTTPTTLHIPVNILWANNNPPVIKANAFYEFNIVPNYSKKTVSEDTSYYGVWSEYIVK